MLRDAHLDYQSFIDPSYVECRLERYALGNFPHGSIMYRVLIAIACCMLVSVASAALMMLADRAVPATPPGTSSAVTGTAPNSVAAGTSNTTADTSAPGTKPGTLSNAASGTPPMSATAKRTADEAAARHAKRTACLKNARLKKLVGAQRTSYVKDCLEPPASASARLN
jgi:hypothetical protein